MRPAPGLTIAQQPEAVLKPLVLWGEARGQSAFTKLCVLWVIKNRTLKHGTTMRDEILKPAAFSCLNHDDPNLPKLLLGWKLEPNAWAVCEAVCELLAFTIDPTGGSDHYYRLDTSPPPKWGRGHPNWQERLVTAGMAFGACP